MPKIVEGPKPKRVTCDRCAAVMEYLPEEVHEHFHSDGGYRRVKCPRPGCPGHGYISSW